LLVSPDFILRRQYGDMVRRRIISRDVVVVTNPVLLNEIIKDKEHFPNRSQTGIRELLPLGLLGRPSPPWPHMVNAEALTGRAAVPLHSMLDVGLDTGDMWYHHRRTIVPMFADRFIRQYGETFARLAKLFCDQTLNKASEENVSVEIHGILSRLTIDAIGTGARAVGRTGFAWSSAL